MDKEFSILRRTTTGIMLTMFSNPSNVEIAGVWMWSQNCKQCRCEIFTQHLRKVAFTASGHLSSPLQLAKAGKRLFREHGTLENSAGSPASQSRNMTWLESAQKGFLLQSFFCHQIFNDPSRSYGCRFQSRRNRRHRASCKYPHSTLSVSADMPNHYD